MSSLVDNSQEASGFSVGQPPVESPLGGSGESACGNPRCEMRDYELEETLACERRQSHEQIEQMQRALEERCASPGLTVAQRSAG